MMPPSFAVKLQRPSSKSSVDVGSSNQLLLKRPKRTPPKPSAAKLLVGNRGRRGSIVVGGGGVPKPEQQQQHQHLRCLVCGDGTAGKNFGAVSCLACAAFFRLSIAQQRLYRCSRLGKCAMDQANRTGCRCCRLEKCLRIGMRKELVRAVNTADRSKSVELLDSGADQLPSLLAKVESPADGALAIPQECADLLLLNSLLQLESQYRRVNTSTAEVPHAYFDQFNSLEELVGSRSNLLSRADSLSGISPHWDRAKCLQQIEEHTIFHIWPRHWVLEHFLNVDVTKRMPFFELLAFPDRIILLRSAHIASVYYWNFFYTAQKLADTLTKGDGLTPVALIHGTKRYSSDPILLRMSERLYCAAVGPFRQTALDREEFVLAFGILLTIAGRSSSLSPEGQELLHTESSKFAAILLRRLQSRLGLLPGVHRYAELVRLVGLTVQVANYYHSYATYFDVFHLEGNRSKRLPPVLRPLYAFGT